MPETSAAADSCSRGFHSRWTFWLKLQSSLDTQSVAHGRAVKPGNLVTQEVRKPANPWHLSCSIKVLDARELHLLLRHQRQRLLSICLLCSRRHAVSHNED